MPKPPESSENFTLKTVYLEANCILSYVKFEPNEAQFRFLLLLYVKPPLISTNFLISWQVQKFIIFSMQISNAIILSKENCQRQICLNITFFMLWPAFLPHATTQNLTLLLIKLFNIFRVVRSVV